MRNENQNHGESNSPLYFSPSLEHAMIVIGKDSSVFKLKGVPSRFVFDYILIGGLPSEGRFLSLQNLRCDPNIKQNRYRFEKALRTEIQLMQYKHQLEDEMYITETYQYGLSISARLFRREEIFMTADPSNVVIFCRGLGSLHSAFFWAWPAHQSPDSLTKRSHERSLHRNKAACFPKRAPCEQELDQP